MPSPRTAYQPAPSTGPQEWHWTDPFRRFFNRKTRERSDWVNPLCMVLLGIIGVFFIHSAQVYAGGSNWIKQLFFLAIGLCVYLVVSSINYKFFMEYAHWLYGASIALLLVVLSPLGTQAMGAQRWIDLGIISLQPSELAKVTTLILCASLLARDRLGTVGDSIKLLLKLAVAVFVPIVLIFRQPDLGSSLVFPPMVFALLYVSNLSKTFFLTVLGIFLLGTMIVGADIFRYNQYLDREGLTPGESAQLNAYGSESLLPLRDYQRNRILSLVAPEKDPLGMSWNLRQSLIAIGSGGLLGKGYLNSVQAKLGYLPQAVAPNDFIFSVLAEETGFLGGVFVIGLFAVLIINGLRIAGLSRDRFGMLLAVGASIILLVHVFINIGMTIGLMPITGLPLPFLSYGGSFVISCCILQGLIQSVYRFRREFA